MLTQLTSFATHGVGAQKVNVEIGAPPGDGKMFIVGLGDTAVKESEQRVRIALRTSGYRFPTGRRITVNLAPASFRKAGPRYDLPIALGLLIIRGALEIDPDRLKEIAFLGELALDGSVRHVTGVLSAAVACREMGIRTIVVPVMDGAEAALIPGIEVIGVSHLSEVVSILAGETECPSVRPMKEAKALEEHYADFADVRGQQAAKRALEIAAAGGHNVLMSGAPGAGKTLLARALRGILPPMTTEEAIDVTQIYSVANLLPKIPRLFPSDRSASSIIPRAPSPSSAADKRRVRVKSALRTVAFFFSTSLRNFPLKSSRSCASRWKTEPSPLRAPREASPFPRISRSSQR